MYSPYCAPSMARKQDTLTTAVPPPTFNLAVPCGNTTFPSCKATCSLASCCFVASVEDNCFVENEPLCGEYASTCAPFFLEGEESFGCLDKINAQRRSTLVQFVLVFASGTMRIEMPSQISCLTRPLPSDEQLWVS
jgi:hypothetical protein